MRPAKIDGVVYSAALKEVLELYKGLKLTKKQLAEKMVLIFPEHGYNYHYNRIAKFDFSTFEAIENEQV